MEAGPVRVRKLTTKDLPLAAKNRTDRPVALRPADLNPGSLIGLSGAVIGDGLTDFFARGALGGSALAARDRVDGAAREVLADEVLREDRQQLTLVERGVRLHERIVDRRPPLPLHLLHIDAAGWHRNFLDVLED